MQNSKKIIRRLLNLSQLIIDEFEVLADLSYLDKEETSQFDDHIHDVKGYLDSEKVVLNNISLNNLIDLFNELQEYDDHSDAYDRCYIIVDDKLNSLLDKDEDISDEEKKRIFEAEDTEANYQEEDDDDIDSEEDDQEEDKNFLNKYYFDEEENEDNAPYVIRNMATIVIKKMLKRIYDTMADNKKDNKYKKRLIKHFKKYKYVYFGLDNQLENLGVSYRFNVDKIPNPYPFDFDTSRIFHNQCVTLLDKLYADKDIDYSLDSMENMLFDMMLLEEYLNCINDESIAKLTELTDELEIKYGHNYFGNIGKQKVLAKKN